MKWLKSNKSEPAEAPSADAPKPKGFLRRLRWPHIDVDLAKPAQRFKFVLFLLGVVVVLAGLLVGGLAGYEYTESAEFCGTTCHSMDPQWTRYQASPHTKVLCAECHIGPGASFFVKSKIDGLRQVYAESFGTYRRPIKSPIHNLRPARDTCEGCHAPTTFKDNIVKTNLHFDNDEKNTPIMNTLVLKMGGWRDTTESSMGIHWHMNSKVYYIAADEQRQVMLWIGVEQADGTLKEFFARDLAGMAATNFVEEARAKGEVRQMDCIDCHNRTAHDIPSPQKMVDRAIEDGLISRDLPYIRAKAVAALSQSYASREEALAAIESLATEYQANGSGGIRASLSLSAPEDKVQSSIDAIKDIYASSNFPDMDLNWQVNPNNEKHTPFLGCFRCHDGNHVLVEGGQEELEVISVKCNLCHTVPIVGRGDEMIVEAPVIVGSVPESHSDFRWTIEHRSVTEEQKPACMNCHGQGFCNNGACHNLSHPEDMAFTHANEVRVQGGQQVCYTCHQNITCTRCHPGGVINLP